LRQHFAYSRQVFAFFFNFALKVCRFTPIYFMYAAITCRFLEQPARSYRLKRKIFAGDTTSKAAMKSA
jgi:hypothetical protein